MADPQVLLSVEGHIATLTLNRPEAMNAMGHDLARDLEAALDRLEAARDVRAVVATGAGDRAFSVGGDIKERGAMSLDERWEHALRLGRCFDRLETLPVPVIAAINGFCFGGGMEMAVACDLRIASERAEVGLLEVKLGVFPGAGGPARLTRLVGKGRAKLVLYTGRRFPAAEGLAFPLARHKAHLELARLMNHKAAWAFDRGLPCGAEANMAKYVAAEAAFQAADQAMQVHGGYGYTTEYHVERYWRDLRVFRIAPVTQEMTLNYIAEHVLGLPKSYGA